MMEQEVETIGKTVCSTCLCNDRNLTSINEIVDIYEIFRLLMYDYAGDRYGELFSQADQQVCWECLALLKKFVRYKRQVHTAQEHLRIAAMSSTNESIDHSYLSQSLSPLETSIKTGYDHIYCDYSEIPDWPQQYISITTSGAVKNEQYDVTQVVRDNINLEIDDRLIEVSEIVLENQGMMSDNVTQLVVDESIVADPYMRTVKGELADITIEQLSKQGIESVIICDSKSIPSKLETKETKANYIIELMTEDEMLNTREAEKQKIQYASSRHKCELCIIGFYNQQQVQEHFSSLHRPQPGYKACRVCFVYIDGERLDNHILQHYTRYTCKLCQHTECSEKLICLHLETHMSKVVPNAVIKIGDVGTISGKSRKRKDKESKSTPPKPGDLRKLLSKTTIEGYQCLECDMFFKNSRARKNHVARFHREGFQCDHCKKRFVNKTTLTTHLRLHEGPLPRDECPVCHKMVRVIQLKYHIQRHQNKSRYECSDCNKVFSHLTTYQAHLKYSRAHASDQIFKFPCPMCNKGYPTKEAMQDHFNYQHLGKTSHKCPVCDKPIASRANVEKHMMRIHGDRKQKPRNHICQQCGKGFTDKKALTQHEVIHSGERPLFCEICYQTFKQKASLYTHKKRIHKVFPSKRVVEFMDNKTEGS